MIKVVVSACLLGAPVRYDAGHKKSDDPVLERWLREGRIVSVCPEMLGGLGAPRPPAEIVMVDGRRRVLTREGRDVTPAFEEGARLAGEAATLNEVRVAVLKSGSPSCGSSYVYDGTFTRTPIPGEGVTTALLRAQGIEVFSENDLEAADDYINCLEHSSRHA
jgi:uncharacterized protein YbbK (DUF523 family)